MQQKLKDFALVTAGSIVMAIGFNSLFLENNIVSGGLEVWLLPSTNSWAGILLILSFTATFPS